jgi:hypothetical protein
MKLKVKENDLSASRKCFKINKELPKRTWVFFEALDPKLDVGIVTPTSNVRVYAILSLLPVGNISYDCVSSKGGFSYQVS